MFERASSISDDACRIRVGHARCTFDAAGGSRWLQVLQPGGRENYALSQSEMCVTIVRDDRCARATLIALQTMKPRRRGGRRRVDLVFFDVDLDLRSGAFADA
jgi:hypothetical protein